MDRCVGTLGLAASFLLTSFLLVRLIIIPVLPLDSELQERLLPPTNILVMGASVGFVCMGSLAIFTLAVLYNAKVKRDRRTFLYKK